MTEARMPGLSAEDVQRVLNSAERGSGAGGASTTGDLTPLASAAVDSFGRTAETSARADSVASHSTPVSQSAVQLSRYLQLLSRWGQHYNLTARLEPEELLTLHLADCAAIVPWLAAALAHGRISLGQPAADGAHAPSILDVGSGAGLPGAVIAALRPDWNVWTIDTVGKKVAFVRQAVAEAGITNLAPLQGSAQTLRLPPAAAQGFDLVVARAVAPLLTIAQWTSKLIAPRGVWALMKGQTPTDEMDAVARSGIAEVFHVEHITVPGLNAERCLVWMRPRA